MRHHRKTPAPARALLVASLLGCFGVSSPMTATARQRHVDRKAAGCSDSGAGAAARPWCHVAAAARRARPGDRVMIHPGVYRELVVIRRSGRRGAPIVFEGQRGAIVDGRGVKLPAEAGLVTVYKQKHVVVRGLTIRRSAYYGVHVIGSADVVIAGNVIERSAHGGLIVDDGSRRIKVLRNEVRRTNQLGARRALHEAISLSNVHQFEVAHNHVHRCKEEGIDVKDGSTRGAVHHNHVERVGAVGIYVCHARDIAVHDNRVHHTGSTGIQLALGDLATGSRSTSNIRIYRNVSWRNRGSGLQFWRHRAGVMKNNQLLNNVVAYNRQFGMLLEHATGTAVHNNIVVFNRLGGIVGNAVARSKVSHNLFFGNRGGQGVGSAQRRGAPRFVNAARGDWRLRRGSPAVNRGKRVGLPFKGPAPDIGAHELR